jgi:hypothetical protein
VSAGHDAVLIPSPDILTRLVSAMPHLLAMVWKKMEDRMERLPFAQALASDLSGERLARNARRLARALQVPVVMTAAVIAVAGVVVLFRSVGAMESYPEVTHAAATAAPGALR